MKKQIKLFVVRKYIYTPSASAALRVEAKFPADDIWVDEDWKKNATSPKEALGFSIDKLETDEA